MIEQRLRELAKQTFLFLAVTLVLSIPLMIFVAPLLDQYPTFDGSVPTATGLIVMGAMVVFSLIVFGMLFFQVLPALAKLIKAIWQARREANGDMFP